MIMRQSTRGGIMRNLGLLLLIGVGLLGFGCSKGSSVSPIAAVGCDIEAAVLGGAAGVIASQLQCSNLSNIQSGLQVALGNLNFCTIPVPAAPAPAPAAALKAANAAPQWKTLGDVTSAQLSSVKAQAQIKGAMKAMGIIGSIACPAFINIAGGYLSNVVPGTWGCSGNVSASVILQALESACIAAVPI